MGTIHFGPFVLELATPELHRDGAPVDIRATPLRLLVSLARRRGAVVPKHTLLDEVWPEVAVGDASLSTAVRELRQALGDDGRQQRWIQTLRGRGYRLNGTSGPAPPPEPGAADIHPAVDGGEDARRYSLLTRLGETLSAAGRHDEGREAHREAARIARGKGDQEKFASAALRFAGEFASVETAVYSQERVDLLREAIAGDGASPLATRARLRARLALNLAWVRRGEALPLAGEAEVLARASGDAASLAMVLHDVYWVRWSPGDGQARLDTAREMVEAARSSEDAQAEGFARLLEGAALLEGGDRAGWEAASERAFHALERSGHAGVPAWRHGWLASAALLDGRFSEVEHHAREALQWGERQRARNARLIHALQLGWLRFDQGRLDELAGIADALVGELPVVRAAGALIRLSAGREVEARRDFAALVDAADDWPRDAFWLAALAILAEVGAQLRDRDLASRLYDLLAPYADQCVLVGSRSACRGAVGLYLGLLARVAESPDAALPHLETAVRLNARLRAVPLLARAQLELARALLDRPHADVDADRAAVLLGQAKELFRGLGLQERVAEIRSLEQDRD